MREIRTSGATRGRGEPAGLVPSYSTYLLFKNTLHENKKLQVELRPQAV